MADKLPFTPEMRSELVRAAQTAHAGGLETTEFWTDFESELGRIEIDKSRQPDVEPRRTKET